jgi:hypothetical protein
MLWASRATRKLATGEDGLVGAPHPACPDADETGFSIIVQARSSRSPSSCTGAQKDRALESRLLPSTVVSCATMLLMVAQVSVVFTRRIQRLREHIGFFDREAMLFRSPRVDLKTSLIVD